MNARLEQNIIEQLHQLDDAHLYKILELIEKMKHEVVEPIQKRQAGSAIGQLIILEDDKSISADSVKDAAEELGIYPVHIVMKRPDGTTEHQGYRFV